MILFKITHLETTKVTQKSVYGLHAGRRRKTDEFFLILFYYILFHRKMGRTAGDWMCGRQL